MPLQTNLYNPIWNLHSRFDRENKKENLSYNKKLGIGKIFSFTSFVRISFLADIGADNLDYYIKPNALIEILSTTNSKIVFSSSWRLFLSK